VARHSDIADALVIVPDEQADGRVVADDDILQGDVVHLCTHRSHERSRGGIALYADAAHRGALPLDLYRLGQRARVDDLSGRIRSDDKLLPGLVRVERPGLDRRPTSDLTELSTTQPDLIGVARHRVRTIHPPTRLILTRIEGDTRVEERAPGCDPGGTGPGPVGDSSRTVEPDGFARCRLHRQLLAERHRHALPVGARTQNQGGPARRSVDGALHARDGRRLASGA